MNNPFNAFYFLLGAGPKLNLYLMTSKMTSHVTANRHFIQGQPYESYQSRAPARCYGELPYYLQLTCIFNIARTSV